MNVDIKGLNIMDKDLDAEMEKRDNFIQNILQAQYDMRSSTSWHVAHILKIINIITKNEYSRGYDRGKEDARFEVGSNLSEIHRYVEDTGTSLVVRDYCGRCKHPVSKEIGKCEYCGAIFNEIEVKEE